MDLDAALANARDMVRRANGTPIRLASKSVRIREMLRRVLELPGYAGVLGFHLSEAIWLVETGVSDDVLVAYPTTHREALRTLAASPTLRESITVMVDSPAHLDFIDEAVADQNAPGAERGEIRVCIDVDASLAMGPMHVGALRSPVHSVEQVRRLAQVVVARPGFRLVGLMAYEGQIAGTTDSSPAISVMKGISTRELAARRGKIVRAVEQLLASTGQPPLEFVNGGGTGSIETTSAETVITEIGAGSGVLAPGLFDRYRSFQPDPAQWFVVPVVRRPAPDVVTVAGGGRVASGPPGADRLPTVDYPAGLRMAPLEGPGEVQTPLKGPAAKSLQLGDHVWFRHAKAGEQAEWFDEVIVVSGGEIVDRWPTYRGEGQAFV